MNKQPRLKAVTLTGTLLVVWLQLTGSCATAAPSARSAGIDNATLTNVTDGRDWAGYGRTFDQQRFSPLTQINTGNVKRQMLDWSGGAIASCATPTTRTYTFAVAERASG